MDFSIDSKLNEVMDAYHNSGDLDHQDVVALQSLHSELFWSMKLVTEKLNDLQNVKA